MSLPLQYTLAGVIILAAVAWLVVKAVRTARSTRNNECAGCSLSDHCAKKNTKKNV